jgi:hypothetical protein
MRRAAKVDRNHSQIVETLRRCGVMVESLAAVGNGVPDLLCSLGQPGQGQTFLVEVKDGTAPASKRRLTPMQRKFHAVWQGKIYLLESVEQALDLVSYLEGRIGRAI